MNYDLKIQINGTHKATTTGIKAVHFALVVFSFVIFKMRDLVGGKEFYKKVKITLDNSLFYAYIACVN